ncbi:MAG: wax ester/triacylglycerol synthase family O-acyltransferase [Thermoleophilaceae bacterium]
MANDRLTALDTSFLTSEDDSTNLCVGAVEVLAGPAPSHEEVVEAIEPRLDRLPRFRQRLATVPLGLGRPRWVDDPHFRITNHVRHAAVPAPGGPPQLQAVFAGFISEHMRRDRPLWELWLVEGLEGGRFAVMHKIHHALVDGIASIKVLETLLDTERRPRAARAKAWSPQAGPSTARLLADAVLERAAPPELVRSAAGLVRSPRRTVKSAVRTVAGVAGIVGAQLNPAPTTPYNRPVGPRRSFSWQRESLDDLKAIKNALQGSLNDAVLAVVAGALGRDLARRGCQTRGLELQVFVPVSVREELQSTSGNEVSGLRVPLPVGIGDPVERFKRIHETMQGLKQSAEPFGSLAATEITGLVPPGLSERLSGLGSRQRYVNVVVSNVPGPQTTLYLRGREVEDVFPCLPIGGNLALGIVIVSYAGKMEFGFTGDADVLPDVDQLPGVLHASLVELAEAAGTEVSEPSPVEQSASPSGGGEPWPGYDEQTVEEIRRVVTRLDREARRRVRAYERRHKDRATVRRALDGQTG